MDAPPIEDVAWLAAAARVIAQRQGQVVHGTTIGFQSGDTRFGKDIAAFPEEDWTPAVAYEAYVTLREYQDQLAVCGIDYADLPVVPEPPGYNAGQSRHEMWALISARRHQRLMETEPRTVAWDEANQEFVVTYPYDTELVTQMKRIPGSRWDKTSKVWRVPFRSAGYVKTFAERNRFTLSEPVVRMLTAVEPDEDPPAGWLHALPTHFVMEFGFDRNLIDKVRNLPGAAFDGVNRNWVVDPSETAIAFAEQHDFQVDDLAGEAAARYEQERRDLIASSAALDVEHFDDRSFGLPLYDYQRAGAAYVLRTLCCFIADEMGLGKTRQALAAIWAARAFPAIVVCPASLKEGWLREAERGMPGKKVRIVRSARNKSVIDDADVVIVSYDIVGKVHDRLAALGPRAIAVDESHLCKNRKAKRTVAVQAIADQVQDGGLKMLLTGTPVLSRPAEMVAQLRILGRIDQFGGSWKFLWRYCDPRNNGHGWDFNGIDNASELHERLRSLCYLRRHKRDVLPDLPPKSRNVVLLSPPSAALKKYRDAERDIVRYLGLEALAAANDRLELEATLAAFDLDHHDWRDAGFSSKMEQDIWTSATRNAFAAEGLVRIATLRNLAVEAKFELCVDWIQQFLISTDRKIVVFAEHQSVTRRLAERLSGVLHSGEVSEQGRVDAEDRFQNDPDCRVIVCNLQTGGTGLTLTAASDVAFVEMGWNPPDQDQCEDRVHRIGQTADRVTAHYLLCAQTIDVDGFEMVERKRVVVNAAVDGIHP